MKYEQNAQEKNIHRNELNLSSEARLRLWQCYSLLLELAEEDEQDTEVNPETDNNQEAPITPIDQTNSTQLKEILVDEQE